MVWSWEEASRVQGGYFTFHELYSEPKLSHILHLTCVCVRAECAHYVAAGHHIHTRHSVQMEGMISVTISNPLKHLFYVYIILYVYVLIPLIPGHFNSDVLSVLCSKWKYWWNAYFGWAENATHYGAKCSYKYQTILHFSVQENHETPHLTTIASFCASWGQPER